LDTKNTQKEALDIIKQWEKQFKETVKRLFGFNNFSYIKYTKAISSIESSNNYQAVNEIWAVWKYQFMPNTLQDYKKTIWWKNKNELVKNFLNTPKIQELIMWKYTMSHITWLYELKMKWKISVKSIDDLVKLLAKAHFTWLWNLDKNYSDWNITANEYAEMALNKYRIA
jgi:hypothetical protein